LWILVLCPSSVPRARGEGLLDAAEEDCFLERNEPGETGVRTTLLPRRDVADQPPATVTERDQHQQIDRKEQVD
jgi:hypothetical protein